MLSKNSQFTIEEKDIVIIWVNESSKNESQYRLANMWNVLTRAKKAVYFIGCSAMLCVSIRNFSIFLLMFCRFTTVYVSMCQMELALPIYNNILLTCFSHLLSYICQQNNENWREVYDFARHSNAEFNLNGKEVSISDIENYMRSEKK